MPSAQARAGSFLSKAFSPTLGLLERESPKVTSSMSASADGEPESPGRCDLTADDLDKSQRDLLDFSCLFSLSFDSILGVWSRFLQYLGDVNMIDVPRNHAKTIGALSRTSKTLSEIIGVRLPRSRVG